MPVGRWNRPGPGPHPTHTKRVLGGPVLQQPSVFTLGTSGIATMQPPNQLLYQANLLGSVNPNGNDTRWQYVIDTTPAFGTTSTYTPQGDAGPGTLPVTVTYTVSGLAANTTYYFALIGQSAAGQQYGPTLSFVTSAEVPLITSAVLPPSITPAVSVPHFTWPVSMGAKGINVAEQDSIEDIYSQVQTVVNTEQGQVPEIPTLGIPDYTFSQMPPDGLALARIIEQQVPRATEDVVVAALDDAGSQWQFQVTTSAVDTDA